MTTFSPADTMPACAGWNAAGTPVPTPRASCRPASLPSRWGSVRRPPSSGSRWPHGRVARQHGAATTTTSSESASGNWSSSRPAKAFEPTAVSTAVPSSSAPAEAAGLAYLGRNCCAIVPGQDPGCSHRHSRRCPSPDPPLLGLDRHRGACRRCLAACLTNAFVDTGQLDAQRCISYWTIEHRGNIDPDFGSSFGRWVFGCDDCQEVCPHNHAPRSDIEEAFQPRPGRAWLDLEWVLDTPADALEAAFQGSPIRRPGAQGLKRNAALVLGNIGDPAARRALTRASEGPDPVVAAQARAALDRIG